ncbi:hypothetical protein GIB67_004635 [Kingdonia uniflora]|uniref:proline--tRNA ligase n=1 Tax=Kingdonia uniflora TaxID=39325 RepID=A0A7J7MD34_9MAGN|nr:hypothetical protein GIB67_004635 [Kingdonia uniflora]
MQEHDPTGSPTHQLSPAKTKYETDPDPQANRTRPRGPVRRPANTHIVFLVGSSAWVHPLTHATSIISDDTAEPLEYGHSFSDNNSWRTPTSQDIFEGKLESEHQPEPLLSSQAKYHKRCRPITDNDDDNEASKTTHKTEPTDSRMYKTKNYSNKRYRANIDTESEAELYETPTKVNGRQKKMADTKEKKPNSNAKSGGKKKEVKKETGLGLTHKKNENFGEWYTEAVVSGEMIEYYDISGCYILRPWTMTIWEIMHDFFDAEIKKMKIKNCYFPVFVSPGALEKEKDHIEGFAPEVAWVTKSGNTELEVPIAIRPTSETVMYPYYQKWIRGHRDLPLKLNQWCNVVRWEFSNPTPFIRSREFLWQEGHTAFATKEEADEEVLQILELYRRIYEEFLAIPVVKGKKSEREKFAGGLYTTSVEAFIPNTGRGVQGATSHCLGQNFAKMFDIRFENEIGERGMVWQNSWAYSTRTRHKHMLTLVTSNPNASRLDQGDAEIIGVMVMVHGDNKGLVLPPKVASIQVIVVPVPYKDADTQAIFDACSETVRMLTEAGLRAEEDLRDNYSPGWKYSHWEMKGVPLRIEIGPKEMANKQVRLVRRDNSSKMDIPTSNLVEQVKDVLDKIQKNLFDVATQKRDASVKVAETWEEFTLALNEKKLILAPWCDEMEVEEDVKKRTKGEMGAAKSLCTPFDQPELPTGQLCFASGKPARKWTYWGRSY